METTHARGEQAAAPQAQILTLLRRLFPFYCALLALITYGYALYDPYQIDGDAIAYMDIGDYLRAHNWPGIVNAYWHPMYPAFLSLGHMLFHATLANELRAYYFANFLIFVLEMLAMIAFTDALVCLREALRPAAALPSLLSSTTLGYLGLALLTIASQRELSLGKIRPDALLQALLLLALAALLTHLATGRIRYAALMGLVLGCAYLTKSFAFLFALLCIAVLALFRWLWLRQSLTRIVPAALVALACFAAVAGPYIAALSHQKGRLDFGDSGSLNLAWYVSGTEKMHLQPYMTSRFGDSEVHLKHPNRELLHSPQIVSYAELPYGTYPDWFDPTYWNDQIKPHIPLRTELARGSRNLVLVVRYLFNHPESLLLLGLFLLLGARFTLPLLPRARSSSNLFWLPSAVLGALAWGIYAIVNTEERYVTFAFLAIILPLFAALRTPSTEAGTSLAPNALRSTAALLVALLTLLTAGESLRTVFEDRRLTLLTGYPGGWYSPTMHHAAEALTALGVRPGDSIACVGFTACLNDQYYARLAGVRILTELYDQGTPVDLFLTALPNRNQAIDTVRATGAKVLVGDMRGNQTIGSDPATQGWLQLDDTSLFALPLNLPGPITPHPRQAPVYHDPFDL